MSRARRSEPNVPAGTVLEGKRKSREPAPRASDLTADVTEGWENEDSDIYQLTLPAGETAGEVFPNIEAALIAATEQLQRGPSSPELPPIADRYRKSRP